MVLRTAALRAQLRTVIANKREQGHVVDGLHEALDALPDSYDALTDFARRLAELPLRADWPYVEPNDLGAIWAECDPARSQGIIAEVDLEESARRVETAFLSSVCGCILGKPLEIDPTLEEVQAALEAVGEWPLSDYVSERAAGALPRPFHPSWSETVRERIAYVAPDDDINYTILGMLILERDGLGFAQADVRDAWLRHLPIRTTFGPERTLLLKAGLNTLAGGDPDDLETWVTVLNPHDEKCGALIRADAYGYACPGRPALAAELAWRDASWTHRRTGIYGAMFVAAAIAAAQVARGRSADDRLGVFETALQYVPQRSRFYKIASDSLDEVRQATDWLDGYRRIHGKYKQYSHCLVYQEVGTLINTLRFAEDVGHGICLQVSQGNDTDSFGATAGSLLGTYFRPGHLEERWLAPPAATTSTQRWRGFMRDHCPGWRSGWESCRGGFQPRSHTCNEGIRVVWGIQRRAEEIGNLPA
jgi:ADP-ribosylglycohydrolase